MMTSRLGIFWSHFKDWAEHTNDHVYRPKFIKFLTTEAGFDIDTAERYFDKAVENGHIYHCCGKYYGVNN